MRGFVLATLAFLSLGYLTVGSMGSEAQAQTITNLKFGTAAQSVEIGKCSAVARVRTRDNNNNNVNTPTNRLIALSGSGFTFYSDVYCTKPVTSITIAAGTSVGKFFWKNSTIGNWTLTAASSGLRSATQAQTIVKPTSTSPSPTPTPGPSPTPTPIPNPTPTPTPTTGLRTVPSPLWGVTTDSIQNISAILQSLQNLSKMPTTRVVFDEWVAATYYKDAVAQINKVSYVMGELLDSYYVKQYTLDQYKARTTEYLNTLGNSVDIWEVANEVNGEWLGDTPTVVAKMTAAYDLVKAQGKRTELTLYYNKDCWANSANEMFTWAAKNVPDRMKQGLDYVLVSFYEDDCNGIKPDWPTVFHQLALMFPNSKIGFGEVGTADAAKKSEFVTRYYNMSISEPNYVGGYFWWYFRQDMVPSTTTLWGVLNDAIRY
jgi:hypothetical protein